MCVIASIDQSHSAQPPFQTLLRHCFVCFCKLILEQTPEERETWWEKEVKCSHIHFQASQGKEVSLKSKKPLKLKGILLENKNFRRDHFTLLLFLLLSISKRLPITYSTRLYLREFCRHQRRSFKTVAILLGNKRVPCGWRAAILIDNDDHRYYNGDYYYFDLCWDYDSDEE